MNIFLVGGAVRDTLLNRDIKDRDWVVVGSTPEKMIEAGYIQVGQDFPVFHCPQTNEEYSLARSIRGDIGSSSVSLEDDLSRRDLTINAMAMDSSGTLIDPHGGAADIEARLLRHVSTAFEEDPIRILRVARFAARYKPLGFTVADDTIAYMANIVQRGIFVNLVPDRVWKEVVRALAEPNPEVFIEVLRSCGALKALMPEVDALFGVPQTAIHHPEVDTGVHVMMVLQQAVRRGYSIEVIFASLMHDLGKGITPGDILPRHHDHEKTGIPLVKALCKRIGAPNLFTDLALRVCEFHTNCHRLVELKASTVLGLLMKLDAFRKPQMLEMFVNSCHADSTGRLGFEDRPYPQADMLREMFAAAKSVDSSTISSEKFKGKKFGDELYKLRLIAIKKTKFTFPPE